MGYHDVLFPEDASFGTRSSPSWSTSIIKVDSGAEERVAHWSSPHYVYQVGYTIKTRDNAYDLDEFFIARNGAENSFKMKDWRDHASTANGRVPTASDPATPVVTNVDVQIGIGNATLTQFQLLKRYEPSGPSPKLRQIVKPKTGTVVIAFDGVNQASGWTVDVQTGLVTFTTAPGNGVVVTAGFEFYIVGRLGGSQDKAGLGGSFDDHDNVNYPQIEVVEDTTTYVLDEDVQYGGSYSVGVAAETQLSFLNGVVQTLTPTGSGLAVRLPDNALLARGGPIAWLVNPSAFSLAVKSSAGTTLFTLPAVSGGLPGTIELLLGDVVGVATWIAT